MLIVLVINLWLEKKNLGDSGYYEENLHVQNAGPVTTEGVLRAAVFCKI